MALTKKEVTAQAKLLKDIAVLTKNNQVTYVNPADKLVADLIAKGFVEVNAEMKDDAGHVAARTTPTGMQAADGNAVGEAAPAAPAAKPSFGLLANVPMPEVTRRSGRTDTYPWQALADSAVGTSFFVSATESMPEPAKSMSSGVSGANKRFSGKAKFKLFAIDDGAQFGHAGVKGAAIYRVE